MSAGYLRYSFMEKEEPINKNDANAARGFRISRFEE
jgi:hypothetical protein